MDDADRFLPLTETIAPDDQAAVAEVVAGAGKAGTAVYPIGGRTATDYGARPTRPGLGLSLAGLNRIVDYPARDLTITVEAGVTIADLAARLRTEGQRLPVDIPQAARATVGGAVATNPSGPRRFRCGTLRDYVIGASAVDGRGTMFSAGGRVVKNAAGYDLCRLLTGSLGTIGVVTQVTLMVKPVPQASALVACDVADLDEAERVLAELVHTKAVPAAIELLIGPAWRDEPALAVPGSSVGRLVVGFEGTAPEVDWMVDEFASQWCRSGRGAPASMRGDDGLRLWSRLAEFPAGGDGALVVEIRVLPSATVEQIGLLLGAVPDASIEAHAGDGVIRARLAPPGDAAGLLDRLREPVRAKGGSLVVLSHPPDVELGQRHVWGPPTATAGPMRAIKSRFDPKGILNPDRFIFASP